MVAANSDTPPSSDDAAANDPADRARLARLIQERPRLMATAAAVDAMRAVLRQNQTAAQWLKKVVENADQIWTMPPLTPDWVHDPAESASAPLPRPLQTNPDAPASALDIARLFVLRIQTLGIVWFAIGDARYRDRAKQELLAVCGFPDWKGDEFLVTAETMFGAAIGYDWLYSALSENERHTVAGAILEKGIRPGFDEFANDPPPHWTRTPSNWNLVCNGALMIAAMAVAEADWPATSRTFELCRGSVPTGFEPYRPDGGWPEGPGYWHYATQYAVYLIDSLTTALGDDLGLGNSPGFGDTGMFRLHAAGPSGKLFNFADSEEQHSGGYWLLWLAKRYRHPVDAWVEEQHVRGKVHPMDLLWFDPDAEPASSDHLAPQDRFLGIDVAMLRGDWDNAGTTYLGVKGGANASSHHAHYDLGSFVLDAGGVRWALDLGPDNYHLTDYFLPEARARYYRTATLGHNTVIVDGQCQSLTARAPLLATRFEPGLAWVLLDMSEACAGCAYARRGFALIGGRDVLMVDEIVPDRPLGSFVWQMHTSANIELRGAAAALTQSTASGELRQLYLRVLEPEGPVFASTAAAPTGNSGQNPNEGIVKLTIEPGQVASALRLAVYLSPDPAALARPDLPAVLMRPLSAWSDAPGAWASLFWRLRHVARCLLSRSPPA